MAQWSAQMNHFNGRYWGHGGDRFLVVEASVPSGAASAAIRKYKKHHVEKGQRIEKYKLILSRIPTFKPEEEE